VKLLEIQSSPRGESSDSITLTKSFIEACRSGNDSIVVDTYHTYPHGEKLSAGPRWNVGRNRNRRDSIKPECLCVDQEIQLRTLMPLVDYNDQIRSTGIIAPPLSPTQLALAPASSCKDSEDAPALTL
jgi:hypothetical protein